MRRGLPHFIHPYRASEDVFTRMLWVLVVILVIQVVGDAADEQWSPGANAMVVGAVLVVLAGAYAAQNRLRGRRAFARPNRVGVPELSVFVLLPAIPSLLKGHVFFGISNAVGNLVLLGIIYAFTSFGIVPMARWTLGHGLHRLASAVSVLLRALPLLLLIVIVVFVNSDAWQVAAGLRWSAMLAVVGLFFLIGAGFAISRVPRQIGEGIAPIVSLPDELPESLLLQLPADPPPIPPLSRRERVNVGLIVLVSEGILVTLAVTMMFVFLLVFGMLAVSLPVLELWTDGDPHVLATLHLFGQEMVLTAVLVKVAAFVAALSGLSFTVSLLSDRGYQEEFISDLDAGLDEAFVVRAVYRLSEPEPDPSTMPST